MDQLLQYMKNVLEGRDDLEPFVVWLQRNDESLQKMLNRGSYLRLKQRPLDAFRHIVEEHNVTYTESEDGYLPRGPGNYSWIKKEWLTKKVFPYKVSPTACKAIVNAVTVDELLHMVELKETGDELWFFSTPPETWETKAGRGGIALTRDGEVIYAIITMMN